MYKSMKALHIVSFAVLLGGLFAQSLGAPAGQTKFLLIAGFWGLTLSGIAMAARGKWRLLRERWLRVHLLFAVAGAVPAVALFDHDFAALAEGGIPAALAAGAVFFLISAAVVGAIKPRFTFIPHTAPKE